MLVNVRETFGMLAEHHYLGPTKSAAFAWLDERGCIVFAAPRARGVPASWVEVVRWCLVGGKNAGSAQWADAVRMLRQQRPDCTTVISYSDPSQGHDGALYRACNWLWAPTWLRLRPPPTGNGAWDRKRQQAVKDRWVFPLAADDGEREKRLFVNDESLMRRVPWASYQEPKWRRGHFDPRTGGGDFKRWKLHAMSTKVA